MRNTMTVSGVTQTQTLSLSSTPTRILNTRKESCVVHICNTHASQSMYISWRQSGLQGDMAIAAATAFETIPFGESRQFQMTEQIEFWGAASGSATTGMAIEMRSPA